MKIDSESVQPGDSIYYTKSFMDMIESHVTYLRNSNKTNSIQVDTQKATIFKGDFYGYLLDYGILPKYHWIVLRVNNLVSSIYFGVNVLTLLIPDVTEIEQIKSIHNTTKNVYM